MLLACFNQEGNVVLHANPFSLKVLQMYLSLVSEEQAKLLSRMLIHDGYGYKPNEVVKILGQMEVLLRSWGRMRLVGDTQSKSQAPTVRNSASGGKKEYVN